MNSHTAKALLLDAFYQVLDNKVFRILILFSILLIAPTFLIAFKPDGISVLFGWKHLDYDDIGLLAGVVAKSTPDANVLAIQTLQKIFVQGLAGSFGIMLSLAATAFFVPRMLEKGEADTLFSKPTGRFVLLLARYVSGVVFVAVLAFVLVLGMHLGLLVMSGYSDPAFLWSVPTLVYVFALIHAFSTMVGVLTRSSIAALLAAIVFFGFNGCIHQIWVGKERAFAALNENSQNGEAEAKDQLANLDTPLWRTLVTVLDVVHYTLPKTRDADVLVDRLRRAVSGPEFALEDQGGTVRFVKEPEGMSRSPAGHEVDLASTPVSWTVVAGGQTVARITASRRTRVDRTEAKPGRPARLSDSAAAREFLKSLESRPGLEGKPTQERDTSDRAVRMLVRWKEKRDDVGVDHVRAFYGSGDWLYEFDFEARSGWKPGSEGQEVFRDFLAGVTPLRRTAAELDPGDWYALQFGPAAPLRFNAWFSVATSLAFAVVMLLIARWRLSRIDF